MGTTKARERAYERRRYEKRLVRLDISLRRKRRNKIIGWTLAAAVAVGTGLTVFSLSNKPPTVAQATPAPAVSPTGTAPDPALAENRVWSGTMALNQGSIGFELNGTLAPAAVANFTQLAQTGFYNGLTCHRLATDMSILQCGDPEGTGFGGPDYRFGPIENAPADGFYPAGTIAMARVTDQAESQGSQFFIVYQDTTIPADSVGGYTVFGTVTQGLEVIQQIAAAGTLPDSTTPAQTVTIESVETQ